MSLVFAALLPVASASAQTWTTYDPDLGTLPEQQGFTFVDDGPPSIPDPEVVGGILHQGPTGSGCVNNDQYWFRNDVSVDFDATFVLEVDLHVISSNWASGADCGDSPCDGLPAWKPGYIVGVTDAAERTFLIGITSEGISLLAGQPWCEADAPLLLLPFDPDDGDFHMYRFVVQNGIGELFIDGEAFTSVPMATFLNVGQANAVLFGDGSHQGSSETELRLLRYRTSACNESCPADLNADGIVNAADLAQLLGAWGPCE